MTENTLEDYVEKCLSFVKFKPASITYPWIEYVLLYMTCQAVKFVAVAEPFFAGGTREITARRLL